MLRVCRLRRDNRGPSVVENSLVGLGLFCLLSACPCWVSYYSIQYPVKIQRTAWHALSAACLLHAERCKHTQYAFETLHWKWELKVTRRRAHLNETRVARAPCLLLWCCSQLRPWVWATFQKLVWLTTPVESVTLLWLLSRAIHFYGFSKCPGCWINSCKQFDILPQVLSLFL